MRMSLLPKANAWFYGCYDWHSSVHGHWLLVRLVRSFPNADFVQPAREACDKA